GSLAIIAYILWGHLNGYNTPGWTSLMLVVVVLGAVQMFVLGMLGEYLGRLYMEAKRRPLYIVADIAGRAPGGAAALGYRAGLRTTASDTPTGIVTRPIQ